MCANLSKGSRIAGITRATANVGIPARQFAPAQILSTCCRSPFLAGATTMIWGRRGRHVRTISPRGSRPCPPYSEKKASPWARNPLRPVSDWSAPLSIRKMPGNPLISPHEDQANPKRPPPNALSPPPRGGECNPRSRPRPDVEQNTSPRNGTKTKPRTRTDRGRV